MKKLLIPILLTFLLLFCAQAEEDWVKILHLQTDPPTYIQWDSEEFCYALYSEEGELIDPHYLDDLEGGDAESFFLFIATDAEDKDGLLSADGRWIAKPQFDFIREFQPNGLAVVWLNGLAGLIKTDGSYLIEPQFDFIRGFQPNGLAIVEMNGLYGLIKADGSYLIEPQFEDIDPFQDNGLAAVRADGLLGLIRSDGSYLFEPQFDPTPTWSMDLEFHEGIASCYKDGLYGYITEDGRVLFEPQFTHAQDFHEGFGAVFSGDLVTGACGYVDAQGGWLVQPAFGNAYPFHDGAARVFKDGRYGFIGTDGAYLIEPRFVQASDFSEGLATASLERGKLGCVNLKGEFVVEPIYDSVNTFTGGLATAQRGDVYVMLDNTGRELLESKSRITYTADELIRTTQNGQTVYYRRADDGIEEVAVVDNDLYLTDYYPFEGSRVVTLDEPADFERDPYPLPRLDGATALLPTYAAFAQALYPDDVRYESYMNNKNPLFTCTKTNRAYERLIDSETDIIFCAGPSDAQIEDAKERGVEFELTLFGYESFVFIVNRDNPLDGITVEQIRAIYSGEMTTWEELGIEGLGGIIAYQRPKNSGSQTALERLMGDTPIMEAPSMYVSDGMEDILETIEYRNLPNAIGYTFRFFCADMVGSKVKLLSIDGVEPNVENIASGAYPIITPLYAVTRKGDDSNPNVQKLLDWITGPQGQELVEKSGYAGIVERQ